MLQFLSTVLTQKPIAAGRRLSVPLTLLAMLFSASFAWSASARDLPDFTKLVEQSSPSVSYTHLTLPTIYSV